MQLVNSLCSVTNGCQPSQLYVMEGLQRQQHSDIEAHHCKEAACNEIQTQLALAVGWQWLEISNSAYYVSIDATSLNI